MPSTKYIVVQYTFLVLVFYGSPSCVKGQSSCSCTCQLDMCNCTCGSSVDEAIASSTFDENEPTFRKSANNKNENLEYVPLFESGKGKQNLDRKQSPMVYCPANMYASAFQLSVFYGSCSSSTAFDCDTKYNDRATGLRSVKLFCRTPGKEFIFEKIRTPSTGFSSKLDVLFKDTNVTSHCSNGFLSGFNLRFDNAQPGVMNLQFLCSKNNEWISGDAKNYGGVYGEKPRKCGPGRAICGIAEKVRTLDFPYKVPKKEYTHYVLRGLEVACCRVTHPGEICNVSDKLVDFTSCRNPEPEDASCNMTFRQGVKTNTFQNLHEELKNFGYTSQDAGKILAQNFKTHLGTGSKGSSKFNWNSVSLESFEEERIVKHELIIKPKTEIKVKRLKGYCGFFEISTDQFETISRKI